MIKITNLIRNYSEHKVLNNIDTDFKDNHIYGIVGYNGAGKSTLFNCISGLISFKGEINIDKNLQIGYLPTDIYMYPKITGLEYIEFCLSARKIEPNMRHLNNWNKIMGLPLNKYAQDYSTGMKKKLALLALILQSNDIIILDEPFNGLDLSTNLILTDIILALRKTDKTVIISSHLLQPLKELCDSIDVLEKGDLKRYSRDDFHEIDKYLKQQRDSVFESTLLKSL